MTNTTAGFHIKKNIYNIDYLLNEVVNESCTDNWLSSRTMAPGSTQLLSEMSTGNLPGDKGRPACKADKFTAICEWIV
jgi:hypothetical protein